MSLFCLDKTDKKTNRDDYTVHNLLGEVTKTRSHPRSHQPRRHWCVWQYFPDEIGLSPEYSLQWRIKGGGNCGTAAPPWSDHEFLDNFYAFKLHFDIEP